ncbi:MAG: maleylpyruvate isomerase family mycothiol-dependent enzyme [Actinomycetota bacterium]|nr:maleylpyruvate isomerase family mycothiol-dependent enzyme [Actinomycetota bacterium]
MADRPVTRLDKSTVLSGLFAVWDDIDALLAGLSEAQWRAASPLPGWDVKALVAHMIGTESFLAGIAAPQPDIDVSTLEHVRNDVGVMNECWVRHLSAHADADVLESFRAITNDRREALKGLSGEEWDAVTMTPTGPDSYGRFMRIRVFDCWMHEEDIRMALGRPPSDDELAGPAASLAVDEIAATMGYVVGKLAKAPDGSRIQFELTGPLARTIRVSVDGRAAVVEDFGGQEPTATIRLDGLQFTRLTGGRPMCPTRVKDIELDGDKGVAKQVVEHLNFVI